MEAAREFFERRREEMEQGAKVLWPDVEDLYTLMRLRAEIGATAFEREKQGRPVNPEMCEWPEEYFGDHIWFNAWPETFKIRVIALDPSKGRDAGRGDYSAFVLLGIDERNVAYVEADMSRQPTSTMVADGIALCLRFRPAAFVVEANQYQELLRGEFEGELKRQNISHIVPIGMTNLVNKQMRIRRLGPLLAQKRLKFLRGSPSTKVLVDQLRDFPIGAHDDGPDALEMALRQAGEMMYGRELDDGLGSRLPVGR
jgi:predicted phage terminase large subunit-like protein